MQGCRTSRSFGSCPSPVPNYVSVTSRRHCVLVKSAPPQYTLYQLPLILTLEGNSRIGGDCLGGERRRFAMPIALRADFDAAAVRMWARKSKDGAQARRLLALAAIYDGASRTDAAKLAGVTLQIVRDWVIKFNAGGPEGLVDRKAPGRAPRLSEEHRKALAAMIEEWADTGDPWRGALAHCRPMLLALRRISYLGVQANPEPATAGHGISQAVGSPASSRPGRGRD